MRVREEAMDCRREVGGGGGRAQLVVIRWREDDERTYIHRHHNKNRPKDLLLHEHIVRLHITNDTDPDLIRLPIHLTPPHHPPLRLP